MLTAAAARARSAGDVLPAVVSPADLTAQGWSPDAIRAQLDGGRWRRVGRAIVRYNGPLGAADARRVALINCGRRALLTSFTAAELHGLRGWERDEIHVLAAHGARVRCVSSLAIRVHYAAELPIPSRFGERLHALAPALLVAAASFASIRPAVGLIAAAVQQRLVGPTAIKRALTVADRQRHRAALLLAVDDITGGSQALSEIDFVRLCRRNRLPIPDRQVVRRDSAGRRRYLDAEWRLTDGRTLAAEIDGALHLTPRRWYDDQLRQNEITLSGTLVLRFPSVIVRDEPGLVVAQLRRALAAT